MGALHSKVKGQGQMSPTFNHC